MGYLPGYMSGHLLLAVILSSASALAQQPSTCSELQSAESASAQRVEAKPSAMLHPGKPLAVEIIFSRGYKGKPTEEWPDGAIKDVCEAARHLEQVWSSAEFQDTLSHIPELILEADNQGRVMRKISGADLLQELLAKPSITLSVAITTSWTKLYVQPVCAESDFLPGETLLQGRYIVDRRSPCGEPPLIPALTNTLGHEYTHYEAIGATDAGKYAVNNPHYVSYGIGCLTQNIGFPGNTCGYSPAAADPGTASKH